MYEHIAESGHRTHFPSGAGLKGRGAACLLGGARLLHQIFTAFKCSTNQPPPPMWTTFVYIQDPIHKGLDDHSHRMLDFQPKNETLGRGAK